MKHSNLEEELEAGASILRTQGAPAGSTERAVTALTAPTLRATGRGTRVAIRLAGFAGTAAVLAVAFWPRTSGGMAWAQVASQFGKVPRVHEVMQLRSPDGKWMTMEERWADGNKYAALLKTTSGRTAIWRFDGTRLFESTTSRDLSMGTIQTVPENRRRDARNVGFLGGDAQSVDDLTKDQHAVVEGQETVKDETFGDLIRYRLKILPRPGYSVMSALQEVYVDPSSGYIRRWEIVDKNGQPAMRGSIEYPDSMDASLFLPTNPLPSHYSDLDKERKTLRDALAKGVGTVHAKGVQAKVRAVVLEQGRMLWVFWNGAPPDSTLSHQIQIVGSKPQRAYTMQFFTASRVRFDWRFHPTDTIKEPLGGMYLDLGSNPPERLTLRVPVYAEDRNTPIKDEKGRLLGYQSRFVGYDELRDVKPAKVGILMNIWELLGIGAGPAYMNGGRYGFFPFPKKK